MTKRENVADPGDQWHDIVRVMTTLVFGHVWNKYAALKEIPGVLEDPLQMKHYAAAFGRLIKRGAIIRLPGSPQSGVGEQLVLAEHMFDPAILTRAKIPPRLVPTAEKKVEADTPPSVVALQAEVAALTTRIIALEARLASRPADGALSGAVPFLPTVFPNFGNEKGKPIYRAPVVHLEWYLSRVLRSLEGPQREQFRGENELYAKVLRAEMARQQGEAATG